MLITRDLRVAPERDVVGAVGRGAQGRLLDGLEVLARRARVRLCRRMPYSSRAPVPGVRARVVEIGQHLAGEAVVADVGHGCVRPGPCPRAWRTRVGSMWKPRACAYSRNAGVEQRLQRIRRCTIAFVLSGIRTRKTPPKNSQAASQASIASRSSPRTRVDEAVARDVRR